MSEKKLSVIDLFVKVARYISHVTATPWAFLTALSVVIIWVILGPYYHYSDTWQLVINTGTTIITFLMVFLIQNSQNRDSKSVLLKLDELLNEIPNKQSNDYINIEELSEEEIDLLSKRIKEFIDKKNE